MTISQLTKNNFLPVTDAEFLFLSEKFLRKLPESSTLLMTREFPPPHFFWSSSHYLITLDHLPFLLPSSKKKKFFWSGKEEMTDWVFFSFSFLLLLLPSFCHDESSPAL